MVLQGVGNHLTQVPEATVGGKACQQMCRVLLHTITSSSAVKEYFFREFKDVLLSFEAHGGKTHEDSPEGGSSTIRHPYTEANSLCVPTASQGGT